MRESPKILIVDDEERNIKLLKAMLALEGYDIFCALGGEEALKLVYDEYPDLILLDVMMPGIDGFKVSRRLKQDEKTRMIPVVMVTALMEKEYRIKALESGADDFLTKPVDNSELLARVKSLLRIKSYHDELADSYRIIADKNEELHELEEMRDGLTHMIIHDLRSPVSAISMSLELLILDKQDLSERQLDTVEQCLSFCSNLDMQIGSLLDISKMEEGKLVPEIEMTDLVEVTGHVLEQFMVGMKSRHIGLFFPRPDGIPPVPVDRKLIERVIANLISNATRHAPDQGQIDVTIDFQRERKTVALGIRDNGYGLPPEHHRKIFEKFAQVGMKKQGVPVGASGLGLAFCKMAVEAHNGRVWVESEGDGRGCAFFFEVPV